LAQGKDDREQRSRQNDREKQAGCEVIHSFSPVLSTANVLTVGWFRSHLFGSPYVPDMFYSQGLICAIAATKCAAFHMRGHHTGGWASI
jgi:hypothetical protein